ncbi:GlxA family transcriptional regulator [Roseibium sp. MMSF_3544]|uniref:GlxA family transcriptional regulator n=1 Tax=unclassified Roseibium TaxID=2629323 RepID=UPI00273DE1B1|nr:helix-turn-helix domain-containing protein [Roseibium sp. MMSF_3544]
MADQRPLEVQLLAIPETCGSALYGMVDVLATSGRVWREISGLEAGPELIRTRIVSPCAEQFRCENGVPVSPDLTTEYSNVPEVLVIMDIWVGADDTVADRYEELSAWLKHCWSNGTIIYSACSGAIMLAAAGLLDGRSATSHWVYEDMFREQFPEVNFDPTPALVFADGSGRLVTAGGAYSWHDLALHIISRHISPGEAVSTAKFFLMSWHADGQLPYANLARQRPHADSLVRRAETWLAANLCHSDPVTGVVEVIGVPERSLKRRFSQATGNTIIGYVQNLRVEAAKQALEVSQKPVDEISVEVGYENVAFFRRLFKRATGLTPREYRKMYEPFWTDQSMRKMPHVDVQRKIA